MLLLCDGPVGFVGEGDNHPFAEGERPGGYGVVAGGQGDVVPEGAWIHAPPGVEVRVGGPPGPHGLGED